MDWQRSSPAAVAPGVTVLEAAAGPDRAATVSAWLRARQGAGGPALLLDCRPQEGGVWAGVDTLVQHLVARCRSSAPELLAAHAQELCFVVPELRDELAPPRTLTDVAPGEEKTRNYPADRAYRNLHGLIDLMSELADRGVTAGWSLACDGYDAANGLVRRFFAELVRRRGRYLGLALLLVAGPGHGQEIADSWDPELLCGLFRPEPSAGAAPTGAASDASAMAAEARVLEAELASGAVPERVMPRLIDRWERSDTPERALRWQVEALHRLNHAGLYEGALPYAERVDAQLDQLYAGYPERYFLAVNGLFFCYVPLGKAAKALAVTEQAVERSAPVELPRLYYLLAMLHARFLDTIDLPRAEGYLQAAIAMLDGLELPEGEREFLAVFLSNGLALVRVRQRRSAEAIALCAAGIERLQAHLGDDRHRLHRSVLWFNIAQVHAQIGPYEDAIAEFTRAMEIDPNYSEYYNDRGAMYFKMGRLDEAEADFLRAIQLSPPYAEVWANLGQCYRAMDRMAPAAAAYSRSLDLEPSSTLARLGRAEALAELGEPEAALADYDLALAADPAQPAVLANRAVLHFEAGRVAEALAGLDAAIALDATAAELYQNRAVALTELGRMDEAAADLRTYLALSPDAGDRDEVELLPG